jgi:hypothetical protein
MPKALDLKTQTGKIKNENLIFIFKLHFALQETLKIYFV